LCISDLGGAGEIRHGPRELQDPLVGARRKAETRNRPPDELERLGIESA
jgi:hypothetical protein